MSSSNRSAGPFQLGDFTVQPARHALRGPTGKTLLEPKVMAVLVMLARSAGEVVERQALIESIWASDYSGDESLTRAISLLRKALGDTRGAHRYIETIPKRGYRLAITPQETGPPQGAAPDLDSPASEGATPGRSAAVPRRASLLAAAVVIGAVIAFALAMPRWELDSSQSAAASKIEPVIAVLPWRNEGNEQDRVKDYVADGLADELLTALTRSPEVSVIASSTTFRFRNFDGDFDRLTQELAITHAVAGVVRRSAKGISVSAQLVEAPGGVVIWSEVVDATETAIFDIPTQLARGILGKLGATPPSTTSPAAAAPDPLAYESYLRATTLLRGGPSETLLRAIDYLEAAVERDPQLADAWAQHAMALLNLLIVRPEDPTDSQDPPSRLLKVRESARRALAMKPDHALARLALATADYRERVADALETEQRYRAILADAPNHPVVNLRMAILMHEVGLIEDALIYTARARELDPLSLLPNGVHLEYLFAAGRNEGLREAWANVSARWSVEPFDSFRFMLLSDSDFEGSRRWAERAAAHLDPRFTQIQYRLIDALEKGFSESEREDLVLALRSGMAQDWINVYDGGQLLGTIGTVDELFAFAAERIAAGDDFILSVLYKPTLATMRKDPRVMELFRRDGVLDYWLTTDRWPDFCRDPKLPYDCETEARRIAETGP